MTFGSPASKPDFVPYRELWEHGRLYFSDPKWFNDPYDPLPAFEEYTKERLPPFIRKHYGANFSSVPPNLYALKIAETADNLLADYPTWLEICRNLAADNTRILCLTEEVTNNLMWSHYANSHRGFAIELNVEKGVTGNLRQVLHKVKYVDRRPLVSVHGAAELKVFCSKSPDWRYENEWRIVTTADCLAKSKNGHYAIASPDSIAGIYLGWQCNLETNPTVRTDLKTLMAANRGLKVFKMIPETDGYKLWAKPIQSI